MPSFLPSSPEEVVAATTAIIASAGIGVYSTWRFLRRQMSRDDVDMRRDRAEAGIISVLQEQAMQDRQRAETAEKDRNNGMVEIGKLQGQVTALSAMLEAVKTELHETREELKATREEFRATMAQRDQLLEIILEQVNAGNKLTKENHDALSHIAAGPLSTAA